MASDRHSDLKTCAHGHSIGGGCEQCREFMAILPRESGFLERDLIREAYSQGECAATERIKRLLQPDVLRLVRHQGTDDMVEALEIALGIREES